MAMGTTELIVVLVLFGLPIGGAVLAVVLAVYFARRGRRSIAQPPPIHQQSYSPVDSTTPAVLAAGVGATVLDQQEQLQYQQDSAPASGSNALDSGYAPDSGGYSHGGCDSSFSGGDSGGGGGGGGGGD